MNKNSWLTMVALRESVAVPPVDEIFARIREMLPDSAAYHQAEETGNVATCVWGEAVVGITLVARPIPRDLLEGPCANAWYWPQASETLRGHGAHLLINLVDESRDLKAEALRMTALTSAVATTAPGALAVFWAPSGMVHEPQAFAEQARQSSYESLPLYLWVDFRIREREPGQCDLFTTGMERLGKREIEIRTIEAAPQQVLEWAYNLAHYQLDHPTGVNDGDTIGLPDGTEFTVQQEVSRIDNTTPVLLMSRS